MERGRPVKIQSNQYISSGFLLAIGGLSEHGWILVEYDNGMTHKYSLQNHWFEFTDVSNSHDKAQGEGASASV